MFRFVSVLQILKATRFVRGLHTVSQPGQGGPLGVFCPAGESCPMVSCLGQRGTIMVTKGLKKEQRKRHGSCSLGVGEVGWHLATTIP